MGAPARIDHADLVIMESTYGDRNHRAFDDTLRELESIVRAAADSGGNILIPAFAVGRTQDLLHLLSEHYAAWQLDRWKIYLDSPMAIETTELYWRYRALHENGAPESNARRPPLANAIASLTTEDSMRINEVRSGALVIAGSGMCNGGRILHHLKHNLWRPECHVVLVGFQARGTLGRQLVDGASHVSLWQETIKVAARIHTVGGLSAHADRAGLLAWYGAFANRPPVCLVHGEPVAQEALAAGLEETYGAKVRVPARGDVLSL
jgi:metallo-beta-lactamase family protein